MSSTSSHSVSILGSRCPACKSRLIRSSHTEHERLGPFRVITSVALADCVSCGFQAKTILPEYYQDAT